jgi:hypothetical protein
MVRVNFRWKKKWPEPTRWARQSLDFLLQLTHSKFPIIASYLVRVVIQHSYGNFNQGNCSNARVDDACAVWVHNSSVIWSDEATKAADTRYLLKMEGTKVHVRIGTIYRRIHQFPLIVWSILLVHHGMFEAWKWLTYIGGGCLYSVGAKLLVVVPFGLLEGGHHGLWAKVH